MVPSVFVNIIHILPLSLSKSTCCGTNRFNLQGPVRTHTKTNKEENNVSISGNIVAVLN